MFKRTRIAIVTLSAAFCALALFCPQRLAVASAPTDPTGRCYLAAHDDVICDGGIYTPPTNGVDSLPSGTDPSPGPAPKVDGGGGPLYTPYTVTDDPCKCPDMTGSLGMCNGVDSKQFFISTMESIEGKPVDNKVYRDPVKGNDVCWGHQTSMAVGTQVTDTQCNAFLQQDTDRFYGAAESEAKAAEICDGCFISALANANYSMGDFPTKNPIDWKKIETGDYNGAANDLAGSPWAHQKGTTRRVDMMTSSLRALPSQGTSCTNPNDTQASAAPRKNCTTAMGTQTTTKTDNTLVTHEGGGDAFVDSSYASYLGGGSVGSGQCVALVQAGTSVGNTHTWVPGAAVQGADLKPGTVIAVFHCNGDTTYCNRSGNSHAAYYVSQDATGVWIVDQYSGHRPEKIHISWDGKGMRSPLEAGQYMRVVTHGGSSTGNTAALTPPPAGGDAQAEDDVSENTAIANDTSEADTGCSSGNNPGTQNQDKVKQDANAELIGGSPPALDLVNLDQFMDDIDADIKLILLPMPPSCGPGDTPIITKGCDAPPAAVAAGFTTCARNDDFTDPQPDGWPNCTAGDAPAKWFFNHWWISTIPCSAVFQTTDPKTGNMALDMQWLPKYAGNDGAHNLINLQTASYDSTVVTDYPNAYYEVTFREQTTPDVPAWPYDAPGAMDAFYAPDGLWFEAPANELDFMESWFGEQDGPDAGVLDWDKGGGRPQLVGANIPGSGPRADRNFDARQYHKWGMLVTGDGTTKLSFCTYLDGQFKGCVTDPYTGREPTQRHSLILWNGAGCNYNYKDSSCMHTFTSLDMYVASVRVWSCANWKNSMCNGTPITTEVPSGGGDPPGGGGSSGGSCNNGVQLCGGANGTTVTEAPSSGLCAGGATASSIRGAGPWFWTCDGGGTSQCLAALPAGAAPTGPAYYVATYGNDGNNGLSIATPFATLGRCQAAMQSSSIKTCYIRGGMYNLPSAGASNISATQPIPVAIALGAADDGETWSYYPPDGYDTAILDGGSTRGASGAPSGSGLGDIFAAVYASNITIAGLQMQRFQFEAIGVNLSSNVTVIDNIIHDQTGAAFGQTPISFTATPGALVAHNYIYNTTDGGVGIWDGGQSSSNTTVASNVIINTCTWPPAGAGGNDQDGGDCAAIYFLNGWGGSCCSYNLNATNNYIRDIGVNSNGEGDAPGCCDVGLYTDNGGSNVTATGNVFSGIESACAFVHAGKNNIINNNICDVDNSGPEDFYSAGADYGITTTGDTFQNNIVVNATGGSGNGTWGYANPPPAIMNNAYYNYIGPPLKTSGAGGSDSNPIFENPQFLTKDWTYTLAPGSPVFNGPVNFPRQPAGWGQPGFWGPPGFIIPETGTAPSYLH